MSNNISLRDMRINSNESVGQFSWRVELIVRDIFYLSEAVQDQLIFDTIFAGISESMRDSVSEKFVFSKKSFTCAELIEECKRIEYLEFLRNPSADRFALKKANRRKCTGCAAVVMLRPKEAARPTVSHAQIETIVEPVRAASQLLAIPVQCATTRVHHAVNWRRAEVSPPVEIHSAVEPQIETIVFKPAIVASRWQAVPAQRATIQLHRYADTGQWAQVSPPVEMPCVMKPSEPAMSPDMTFDAVDESSSKLTPGILAGCAGKVAGKGMVPVMWYGIVWFGIPVYGVVWFSTNASPIQNMWPYGKLNRHA